MDLFNPKDHNLSKYLFFTGKGGVGKTSTSCAVAVSLAEEGKKTLLISTDPASNLQDVFSTELTSKEKEISGVNNLFVANIDPVEAANEYKESVLKPFRGQLPADVLANMEEQLSGSCTVEIAAFNEFSNFLTDSNYADTYDHIIFDTAPTGHTLRLLQLPAAWNDFIGNNPNGASCLGQLSGLEGKKEMYSKAVSTLSDKSLTTLILVSRPEISPLEEAERSSKELADIGIKNQLLIVNGVITEHNDEISKNIYEKQQSAIKNMPKELAKLNTYIVPMRAYNISSIDSMKKLFYQDYFEVSNEIINASKIHSLNEIIDDLSNKNRKVIFTMGKGGVGKTTLAAAIALGLAKKGKKVHLATTDPASHLQYVLDENSDITMSHIDEKKEYEAYQNEVLTKARETMSEEDIAYIEEDLRSPCTQEIAVFRAFANIVDKSKDQVVVIDTAPTGHTLLLLDSTQSYHKEVQRSSGQIPDSVRNLLPRLYSEDTEVIIVSLPEMTPYYEAKRLEDDLKRAKVPVGWWVVNSSLYKANPKNKLLATKAQNEIHWINEIDKNTDGHFALVEWKSNILKGEELYNL